MSSPLTHRPNRPRRIAPWWWGVVAWIACALWSSGAAAQPLHKVDDGAGIKLGERTTFHPGFALTTGVDTNVFYESPSEGPQAAAYMTPTGWLGLGNRQVRDGILMTPPERSARILDYNIAGIMGFRQYLARRENVRQQSRITGGLVLRLHLLPGRRFSVALEEDFFRYAQPSNYDAGAAFNFNRIDHRGALTFFLRPGGGRLSFGAGYRSHFLGFQNAAQDIAKGNRLLNGMLAEIKWRFMPKTALLFQYTFDHTYYLSCCASIGRGRNEDNFAHRIKGGVRGQVLKKVTLDAMAGWGFGHYRDDPNGPNFSSFIGDVGINIYPTLRSVVHLSAFRSFQDSLLGNYFIDVGGRAGARHQFRWNMIAGLGVSLIGRKYAGLPVPGLEDEDIFDYQGPGSDVFQRRDVLVNLDARIEQPIRKIFAVALHYDMTIDRSRLVTIFNAPMGGPRPFDIAGFNKHVIMFIAAVRI